MVLLLQSIKKVKTLEKTVKSRKAGRKTKLVVSNDEEEDSFNQGRKIAKINKDLDISLVYTTEPDISIDNVPVSTDGAEVSTAAESLVYIRRSAAKRKDKGKAIVEESKPIQTKTKIQQEQERLGFKVAQILQEQFDNEEGQRITSVHEEASTFKPKEWDSIQAQIEAVEELANRLQLQERERYSKADKAKLLVELINERKRQFSQQRAQQRRNRPLTQAQQRYMHDSLTWRLYDTCGVHHVSIETGLDFFMLVEKDYPLIRGLSMLMLVNKLINDLDEIINEEAQELLANEEPGSFLSRGLEKSINQSDLECCKSTSTNEKNGADSENSIRRIDSANLPHPVTQGTTNGDDVKSEHLYSASANEIGEKKPELKNLPQHLEYAYLHGDKSFPIIISSKLSEREKISLLQVLERRKGAIAWKMSDIKGISPSYCTHKILMEDDYKPVMQPQRRLNLKVQDVVKNENVKLLDYGLIYPILDSLWVSSIHVVPKRGGMTVVLNDNNELIPS
ncbi:hypothetical protein Tco_1205224 [Tanacetum coccineum]